MFQLLGENFDGVIFSQFLRDLDEKNWIILFQHRERLLGFSTVLAYETRFEELPVSVIYSGDTIVSPEAWGTTKLFRAWISAVHQIRRRYLRGPFFWLLLTSGFRTYRLLPLFWREFFPGLLPLENTVLPRLMKHLASEKFGHQFDASSGIVRLDSPQRLGLGLSQIPEGRLSNPHIQFFLERNPGHWQGDELVSIASLDHDNLTAAGRRMLDVRE
jgi:hypothetical protein